MKWNVFAALEEILTNLQRIEKKENMLMATIDDVNAKLDAIPPVLDAIVADEQAQKDLIQQLKDQIAAGTPVTQDQLDQLAAKADSILSRVQSIDANVDPANP